MTFDRDIMGALASWLCMVHCLAGPIMLVFGITTTGLFFFDEEMVHKVLLLPIVFFAMWSIPRGFRKHKIVMPLVCAVLGIICFMAGLMIHDYETTLTVVASCMLIFAHLYNKKLLKTNAKSDL